MKELIASVPRFLFFTGKGGVGKTSMSCVVASALADQGKRVLLISTDPASNLDEVLEYQIENIFPGDFESFDFFHQVQGIYLVINASNTSGSTSIHQ